MAKKATSENSNQSTGGLWEAIKQKAVDHTATVLVLGGASLVALAATTTWAALKQWTVIDTPAGVVIASINPCEKLPGGWSLFKEAGGRFIIGAGVHDKDATVSKSYSAFSEAPTSPQAGFELPKGGEEAHALTLEEMPNHGHRIATDTGVPIHDGLAGGTSDLGILDNFENIPNKANFNTVLPNVLEKTGGLSDGSTKAHNTIPPYIALYFCKKD